MADNNKFIYKEVNVNNIEDLVFECTSPLAKIILTKEFYSGRNIELKDFTENYLKEDYKDYLFHGRPTLYARVIRDLFDNSKNNDESKKNKSIDKVKSIQRFLNEKNMVSKNSERPKQKTKQDPIDGWRSIINPKGH